MDRTHRSSRIIGRLAALLLPALLAAAAPGLAGTVDGRLAVSSGYLDHPIGVSTESSAGYLSGEMTLSLLMPAGQNTWKLGYEGTVTAFGNDVGLGFQRHAVGLEWWRTDPATRAVTAAGVQVGRRIQEDVYSFYDYTEATGYFSLKRYLSGSLLWRGYLTGRTRRYDDLSEESYLEGVVGTSLQRFWASGTSLAVSASLGGKVYDDPLARVVWETPDDPTTSQAAAGVVLTRNLGPRAGLRLGWTGRWSLATFPYVVEADLYDSPLLDRYASEGHAFEGSLRLLLPWPAWLRIGGVVARDDYGPLQFASADGGAVRRDDIVRIYASLRKRLGPTGRAPELVVGTAWRDQSSTLSYYDFSGVQLFSSLGWSW